MSTTSKSKIEDEFSFNSYASITGCDIVASLTLPGKFPRVLGNLSLLSISTHRDKFPVTSIGRVGPKGFTYGHRTIGGTLVFEVIDRSILYDLGYKLGEGKTLPNLICLPDELPPFDITITMVSEDGSAAAGAIKGVTILDEGMALSIDNIVPMETYSYMALGRTPIFNLTESHKLANKTFHGDIVSTKIPDSWAEWFGTDNIKPIDPRTGYQDEYSYENLPGVKVPPSVGSWEHLNKDQNNIPGQE